MDDHMLDRINSEIQLCFSCIKSELGEHEEVKDNMEYKSAAVLIKAYNQLVKLYYLEEYRHEFLKGSVAKEYKEYLENEDN